MSKSSPSQRRRTRLVPRKGTMVFGRLNYVMLLIGVALIVIGYVVMRAENKIDGFLSLYVAPLVLIAGYVQVFIAFLVRKDDTAGTTTTPPSAQS